MSKSIPVSEKHGVNPSMLMCLFCDEPKGIAMLGRLPNDAEAPRQVLADYDPCDKCKAEWDKGVVFIGTTTECPNDKFPPIGKDADGKPLWPTGSWTVLTDEGVKQFISWPQSEEILLARKCFVPQEVIEEFDKHMKSKA